MSNNHSFKIVSFKNVLLLSCVLIVSVVSFILGNNFRKITKQEIIKEFHLIYDEQDPYCLFLGIPSSQYPVDNWVLQEIIYEIKPRFIIETGTYMGGTSLFCALILEQVKNNGEVITIDVKNQHAEAAKSETWRRCVDFILGDSVSDEVISKVAEKVENQRVLVFLDSSHSKEHVLKELRCYSPFVSLGSYMIVNDTSYGGNPIPGPPDETVTKEGAHEAVLEFLKENDNFIIDHSREKHLVTQNKNGYLKRIK